MSFNSALLLHVLLLVPQPLLGNFFRTLMEDDQAAIECKVEFLQHRSSFVYKNIDVQKHNDSLAELVRNSETQREEDPLLQANQPSAMPSQVESYIDYEQFAKEPIVRKPKSSLAELNLAGTEMQWEGKRAQTDEKPMVETAKIDRLPLLPYPAQVQLDGLDAKPFEISAATRLILGTNISDSDLSVWTVKELLSKTTSALRSNATQSIRGGAPGSIQLELSSNGGHPESYFLRVQNNSIVLKASTAAGLFYGSQTLKQLVSKDGSPTIPAVTITDQPRFQWRGLHLDVSRHFFTAEHVKSLLETMAEFKLNRFHWHLTDDQGWRLPVGPLPNLTLIGAASLNGAIEAYTEAEIRDVVAFAKERHIEVLPEIDIPGHAAAAIAAYPELGNTDIPDWQALDHPIWQIGVQQYTLAPSPKVLDFLDKVYTQVVDLFPGSYVHIGGDEAPLGQWNASLLAQSISQNGSQPVQRFFNKQLSQILGKWNRTLVGWDEVQHMGGLPNDAVIMAWRGVSEMLEAVQSGRPVVNSNMDNLYFDHYQGPRYEEPEAICCSATRLEKVYNFDPMPKGLTEEQQKLILGAQGQLWSEHFPTWHQVEYMAFPRALALAERAWTPSDQITEFSDFRRRLLARLPDLDSRGVAYRKLDDEDLGQTSSYGRGFSSSYWMNSWDPFPYIEYGPGV